MRRTAALILSIFALAGTLRSAAAEDPSKSQFRSAAPDAGIAELGERGGIFKKHGLNLDILYTSAVRNRSRP